MANTTTDTIKKTDMNTHDYKNKMQSIESQLDKITHSAGQHIGAMASDVANTTTRYLKDSGEYVRENPGKSIAVAAAAGAVAGSIVTMLLRRK